MSKFASRPLDAFLVKLGSSDAAPGGGAAAAVVIAQAAALAEMVARLNLRRSEKQGASNPLSRKNITPLSAIRRKSLQLLEEDIQCFLSLSKYNKADRGKAAYLKAVEHAAEAPYRMCVLAEVGIALAASEKSRSSDWIYSDLLESAILFDAGFRSARLNAEVNLFCLKQTKFVAKMTAGLNLSAKKIKKNYDVIFKGKKR